jgi:hypothetical protein
MKEIQELRRQFGVILKAAKMRAVLETIKEKKNQIVRNQDFEAAALLRDKEKVVLDKLEEINKEMLAIYAEHFPEESINIEAELL